jgi:hypothetical protein
MKKTVIIIIVLLFVTLSFSLGFILSSFTSTDRKTQRTGITDFSVETRAICEELKNSTCYYKCHDEVFLIIGGREVNIHKSNEYVCHEEGWVDPRIKK